MKKEIMYGYFADPTRGVEICKCERCNYILFTEYEEYPEDKADWKYCPVCGKEIDYESIS